MENTTQPAPNGMSIGIRYGLVLSVISIVFFLILAMSGVNQQESPLRWLGILFTIGALYLAHKNFKDSGDGFMGYGQGVGIGFWVTAISSVISTLFMYVYIKFVDTTYMEMVKDMQMEKLAERGMSDEEIEQAMEIAAPFMSPEMILLFGILGGIFIGMIIVLVVTAITQKKNPQPTF